MSKVTVQTHPETSIVGLVRHGKGSYDAIPQLWEQLNQRQAEVHPQGSAHAAAYGISLMAPDFAESGEFDYFAGFPSDMAKDQLPEGMVSFVLPEGLYAKCVSPNLDSIQQAFDAIYVRWLPGSDYVLDEARGNFCFEVYDERFDPATGNGAFDVFALVKRK